MPEHPPTSLSEQDQLLPEQDIVEVITDAWSQDLTDLWFGAEQYLTALTTGNIPPDPNAAGDFMRRVTQSEEITPSILGCCVHIARQIIEQTHEIAVRQGETTGQPDYGPILVPLSEVDEQTLQAMLESETFSIDTEYALGHTSGQTIAIGRILTKVYGNVSMLDLADPDNKAFNDPLAIELRSRPDFIAAVVSELHRPEPWREGTSPRDIAYLKRFWADRFLQYVGNMPAKLRYDLLFDSISRTAAAKDPSDIDDRSLESLLIRTAANLRVIGVDNALLLNEKAGIVSFDYYDADQLRLTALFAAGDREAIEHLQAGDVTVVFTNTKDDDSGALSNTAHTFRTPNSRTLFFEIANLEDAIGYLELLRQNGIRPSTFVYSDHGLPDGFDARLSGKNVRVTHNTLAGPTLSGAPRVGLQ
ncbi:MAG TPA: hypothetical protein VIR03_01485, partial [Candidatus Saccharimonadales bacterium]